MRSLYLNINNVVIKVNLDFDKYYQFLETYFFRTLLTEDKDRKSDIEVNIKWLDQSLSRYIENEKNSGNFVQIGGSTLKGKNRVIVSRKIQRKLKVIYDIIKKDDVLEVNLIMQRKPFADFFRYGPLSKPADEWFFAITYYFIYYPLFWYMQQRRTFMLHASAMSFKDKGIVICGLEGIGKTSLALMFLEQENSRFLSDNLVFFDDKNVYPCYELLRLHQTSGQIDLDEKFEKINQFRIIKDFYAPKFNLSNKGISPDIMIFSEFSKEFFVRKMSVDEAVNRAIVLSYLPAELNNYFEYRNVFDLLTFGEKDSVDPRKMSYEVLRSALTDASCYEIGMPKKDGLRNNFKKLKETIFLK